MRPDAFKSLTGQLSSKPYPSGIGLPGTGSKFTTSGEVELWKGNTFVSHVSQPSDAYHALVEMQEAMKRSEFSSLVTWLPAPSFHMTVFQGMSPGKAGSEDWPEGMPVDASRDEITAELLARTGDITLPTFKIRATELFCGNSLTVVGADDHHETVLRDARTRLRDATGMYPTDFETYVFHITLGYHIAWLSQGCAEDLLEHSASVFSRFEDRLQDIPLDPCALCSFDSMHHFEPVAVLA